MRMFVLIMIELPGIGNSPAADAARPYYACRAEAIDALRQHLGLQRWAVLSFSSGTRAAEAYLQRHSQQVSRAAFLCPAYVRGLCHIGLKAMIGIDRRWPAITTWTLSGWRLDNLILFFGFNGRRHPRYTADWEREIGGQRVESLKSRPRRLGPDDCLVPGMHSAPLMEAEAVAQAVIPFLNQ